MAQHAHAGSDVHEHHTHEHGQECGHTAVRHDGHTDYLHDGHMHNQSNGHVMEHRFDVNAKNPDECTPNFHEGHEAGHRHGPDCGHEAVPHGDHTDYLVDGKLHHPHGDHCDDHGEVEVR